MPSNYCKHLLFQVGLEKAHVSNTKFTFVYILWLCNVQIKTLFMPLVKKFIVFLFCLNNSQICFCLHSLVLILQVRSLQTAFFHFFFYSSKVQCLIVCCLKLCSCCTRNKCTSATVFLRTVLTVSVSFSLNTLATMLAFC